MSANSGAIPDAWEDSWETQADVCNNGHFHTEKATGEPLKSLQGSHSINDVLMAIL